MLQESNNLKGEEYGVDISIRARRPSACLCESKFQNSTVCGTKFRLYPGMDELLDPAIGEAAEQTWPLAVPGHALEGPHLVLPIEEGVDPFPIDPDQDLPRLRPFPLLRRGPVDLEHLVRHGPLQRHHLQDLRVHHIAPARGQAVQDTPRLLRDHRLLAIHRFLDLNGHHLGIGTAKKICFLGYFLPIKAEKTGFFFKKKNFNENQDWVEMFVVDLI